MVVVRAADTIDHESWGHAGTVHDVRAALDGAGLRCSEVLAESASDLDELRDPGVIVFAHARHLRVASGERVPLVTLLEERGIAFVGSGTEGQRSRLKMRMKTILGLLGMPTPRWAPLRGDEALDLRFPIVVKPNDGGSSIGVLRVEDRSALAALRLLNDGSLFAEEWVREREYTVAVIGNGDGRRGFGIEIIVRDGDAFLTTECKDVGAQRVAIADSVTRRRVESLAVAAAAAVSVDDWCRVDILQDADGAMYVIDVNALPGLRARVSDFPVCLRLRCAATHAETVLVVVGVGLLRRGLALPPSVAAAHAKVLGPVAHGIGGAAPGACRPHQLSLDV